jgi:hypothetical protein
MTFTASYPSGDAVLLVYGGSSGSPFIKDDKSGQMNVFNLETKEWKQYAQQDNVGNALPSTGSNQSALGSNFYDGIILQVGGTSDFYFSTVGDDSTNELPCARAHSPMVGLRTSHGVLMGIAWGFFIPMGIFVARFGREVLPVAWFQIHRALNVAGVIISIAGFVCGYLMTTQGHFSFLPHAAFGLLVVCIGFQQLINGIIRPHKDSNEPKTKLRKYWEMWHKYTGRLGLVLGLINPILGIIAVAGISSPGFIVYIVWFIVYFVAWIILTFMGQPKNGGLMHKLSNKVNLFSKDNRFKDEMNLETETPSLE